MAICGSRGAGVSGVARPTPFRPLFDFGNDGGEAFAGADQLTARFAVGQNSKNGAVGGGENVLLPLAGDSTLQDQPRALNRLDAFRSQVHRGFFPGEGDLGQLADLLRPRFRDLQTQPGGLGLLFRRFRLRYRNVVSRFRIVPHLLRNQLAVAE